MPFAGFLKNIFSSVIFEDEQNLCTCMYIYVLHFINRCRLTLVYRKQLYNDHESAGNKPIEQFDIFRMRAQ